MAPLGRAGSYSSFVFDLDGTLIRLPVRWWETTKELESLFGVDRVVDPMFSLLAGLIEKAPHLRAEAFSIIDRYELESIPQAEPVPGSADLVKALDGQGKVCLVTMQGKKACEAALAKLGISGAFSAIVTREDSLDRGLQIGMTLALAGESRSTALFVADLENDVVNARKVGVDTAIIGSSYPKGLEEGHLFPSCKALSDYLFS